ncbi:MAG: mannose-1-phosphate guanylyltransferase [Caulobacteraceae bacterium]
MAHRIIPAIMSGGAGTRLWPLSTEDRPKQFHALIGTRTLFAEAAARVHGNVGDISFAPPIVLCGETHVASVRAALDEISVFPAAIVIEPAPRNTAAVAAVAAALAQELDPDALVLLIPSDHLIADVAAFHATLSRAAPFARDRIVTFGIKPRLPATDYGYIKSGATLAAGLFEVDSFNEKPDAATAEGYLSAGGYFWNSGMFLFRAEIMLAEFDANSAIRECALRAMNEATREGDRIRLGAAYVEAPSAPLDVAVMEKTQRAAVIPCDIGWADIGSWAELWRLAPRGPDGFAVLGPAAAADATKIKESGVRAAVADGPDLLVVATPKGLLILPRERAQDAHALRELAETLSSAT